MMIRCLENTKLHNLIKVKNGENMGRTKPGNRLGIIPGKAHEARAPSTGLFCIAAKSIDHP